MNLVIASVGIINMDTVSRYSMGNTGRLTFYVTMGDNPSVTGDEAKAIWAALVYTAQHPGPSPVTIGPYDPETGKTEHRTYNPPDDDEKGTTTLEAALEAASELDDHSWYAFVSFPEVEQPIIKALQQRYGGKDVEATPLTPRQWEALLRRIRTNEEQVERFRRNAAHLEPQRVLAQESGPWSKTGAEGIDVFGATHDTSGWVEALSDYLTNAAWAELKIWRDGKIATVQCDPEMVASFGQALITYLRGRHGAG